MAAVLEPALSTCWAMARENPYYKVILGVAGTDGLRKQGQRRGGWKKKQRAPGPEGKTLMSGPCAEIYFFSLIFVQCLPHACHCLVAEVTEVNKKTNSLVTFVEN